MKKTQSVLLLKVNLDGAEQEFRLPEGKKFVIGRAPSCQLKLTAPNISSEHLEVYFFESQVRVRDLSSANGTFRSPNKAPFVEALFPHKFPALDLLLAKTPLTLAWQVEGESLETQIEKTIPLSELPSKQAVVAKVGVVEPPRVLNPQQERSGAAIPEQEKGSSTGARSAPSAPVSPSVVASVATFPAPLEALALWFPMILALVGTLFGIFFLRQQFVRGLLEGEMGQGLAWDQFIFWFLALRQQGWVVLILMTGCFTLGYWFLKSKGKIGARDGTRLLQRFFLTLVVSIVLVLLPWLRLIGYGVKVSDWGPLMRLVTRLENSSLTVKDKHAEFKHVLPRFRGSSYFYARRFKVQTLRVVEECDGAGERPWENKKVCLVLLHAVGVENLEDFAPVFLKDAAFRNTLILSLDGIMRVLAVEGPESKTLNYFINSLALVGLESERAQIYGILYEKALTKAEILEVLQELRQSLEQRVQEQYRVSNTPTLLQIRPTSSIELGI